MLIGPQNLTPNVTHVRSRINEAAKAAGRDPATVTLVAVTKAKAAESMREAATAGVTDFGENYLKEALGKMEALGDLPLRWHFIGALQWNKTRPVAEHFDWVHSIDRLSVARRLSEQRPFHAPPLNVCIQVALVPEPTKGGVAPGSDRARRELAGLPRLKLRGLSASPRLRRMCAPSGRFLPGSGAAGGSQRTRARPRYTVDGNERGLRIGHSRRGHDGEDRNGDIRQTVSGPNMHNIRRLAFIGGATWPPH